MSTTTTYKKEDLQAIIIAGGSFSEKALINYKLISAFSVKKAIIICVDSGLNNFERIKKEPFGDFGGIEFEKPDFLIGDFDSCKFSKEEIQRKYPNLNWVELNPIKDFTDNEVALDVAVSEGATEIIMFGVTGSRMDHTMTNILLMEKYEKMGIKICAVDDNNIIMPFTMENHEYTIPGVENHYVSIIALSESLEGINSKGMEYELSDRRIERTSSLGVSNRVISEEGRISFKKGKGVLILSRD